MKVETAREIIKRAMKDDVYEGSMPELESEVVTVAQEIVEQAEDAWSKHIRGPEVEATLKLAAADQNGDDPEAKSESESDDHAPPETDEKVPTLQSGDAKLTKMDPWEGYSDDPVKDIVDGVNYFAEEDPSTILEVLRHVWQFETAHKNRARILTHISDVYAKHGGTVEQETDSGRDGEETENAGIEEAKQSEAEASEPSGEDAGTSENEELSSTTEGSPESESERDAEADAEPKASSQSRKRKTDEAESSKEDPEGRSGGSEPTAYQKLIKSVENELHRERLDVPKPPDEAAPELPWNWGEIKDSELRELYMRYAACAYYKSYRLSRHERISQHCKEAADALHNERMVSIEKYDEKGKEKKVGLIEAEIAMDQQVKRWRVLQRKHEQLAAADRREMDSYYKIVEALSRLESMRHNAWERARR